MKHSVGIERTLPDHGHVGNIASEEKDNDLQNMRCLTDRTDVSVKWFLNSTFLFGLQKP